MKSLSPAQHRSLERELHDGEQLAWIGAPSLEGMFLQQAPQLVLLTIILGIALKQLLPLKPEGVAYTFEHAPTVNLLGFGLFASAALAGIVGLLWRLCATGRTTYAVTNQRILIVTDLIRREVISIYPDAINSLEQSYMGGRLGSITFRRETVDTGEGNQIKKMKFVGISDAAEALRQIEVLRSQYRRTLSDR